MLADDAREVPGSTFSWALWKVLDKLSRRYMESGGGLSSSPADPHSIPPELLASMDRERMLSAARELADESSLIVQALARVAAAREAGSHGDHVELQPYIDRLGPEQLLVMATVLVQMEKPVLGQLPK